MPEHRRARDGDCVVSIAFEEGFYPATIWDHPENERLKAERGDPHVLMPGDVVYVPDRRVKTAAAATDATHRFRRRGVPHFMRVRLCMLERPLAEVDCTVEVDALPPETHRTDADGWLTVGIPPNARVATITLPSGSSYTIDLGRLAPADTVAGTLGRLHRLGLYRGRIEEELTPQAEEAIRSFQETHGISPADGRPNPDTARTLKALAGA